MLKIIRIIFRR